MLLVPHTGPAPKYKVSESSLSLSSQQDNRAGGCRYGDCSMGRLITDAMLDACPDCDVAMINSGGIRGSFVAGPVYWVQLHMSTYVYVCVVVHFDLTLPSLNVVSLSDIVIG